jgi:hypothetical protein
MMQTQSPASRPYVFRGPLAFNQRSLLSAFHTIFGRGDDGQQLAHATPISLSGLANVLMLLEALAMSNGMFIDGTLPPKDLELLAANEEKLACDTGVRLGTQAIRATREQLPGLFKDAAETASLTIGELLDGTADVGREKPIPGDIKPFVTDVERAAEDPSGRVRQEIADGICATASDGRESYRGSKCVAGIMCARPDAGDILPRAAERLKDSDDATARRLISGMVNRFRINYINSLAGLKQAAYLADGSVEDLKGAQVILFWRYLTRKLAEKHKLSLPREGVSVLDTPLSAAPLGVAILLNTSGSSPRDLLKEAMSLRDRGFCRAAASDSPQERYFHEMNQQQFDEFQEYHFAKKLRRLMKDAARDELPKSRWRTIWTPAALGEGLAAIVAELVAGPLGAVGAAVAGSVMGSISEDVMHGKFRSAHVYVDNYRKIDSYLKMAFDMSEAGETIAESVQTLFGRPLAGAGKVH